MATLLGKGIRMVTYLGDHDIHWRHHEPTGFLRTGEYLKYRVYKYEVVGTKQLIPVFIQQDWVLDKYRVVTPDFQYGELKGRVFLVLHNKQLYKPHQQSFLCADVAELLIPDEQAENINFGPRFSWGFMDQLLDYDDPDKPVMVDCADGLDADEPPVKSSN